MIKKVLFTLSIVMLNFSCSTFYNIALSRMGVYDDTITSQKYLKGDKEVVLFPMHHVGTPLFYEDIRRKVDSMTALGYFFYTEEVKGEGFSDTNMRKLRKIMGTITRGRNLKTIIDTINGGKLKSKLKKELVNQPSDEELGVTESNGKNVDATLAEMIQYYEQKNGAIILEKCDFETGVYENTACDEEIDSEKRNDLILDSRNEIILKTLDVDLASYNKIGILYGANHMEGIREGLVVRGFSKIKP